MPTATRYATEKSEHGLLVRDVVLAVEGDTGRGFDLTREDFDKFVSTFERRVSREFIGAYVRLGHDGPRTGKLTTLKRVDGNLTGNVLIEPKFDKDGAIAGKLEAGDITDLSITFSRQYGTLVDVSLLEDTFGQLHEKLPPLRVDVKQEFDIEPDALVALSLKESQEAAMPTLEEFGALLDKKLNPVIERVTKLETTKKSEPAKAEDGNLVDDPDLADQVKRLYGDKLVAMEQRERERDIESKLTQLSVIAGGATSKQAALWRSKLEECKDADLLNERFERMKDQLTAKKSAPSIPNESGYARLSIEAQLGDEWESLGGKEKLGLSKQEYINHTRLLADDLR